MAPASWLPSRNLAVDPRRPEFVEVDGFYDVLGDVDERHKIVTRWTEGSVNCRVPGLQDSLQNTSLGLRHEPLLLERVNVLSERAAIADLVDHDVLE